jgi:hypothetical protein
MGFKDAKRKVIDCLNTGHVLHEQRDAIDVKNLLAIGAVSINDVTQIIKRARGDSYSSSPHHYDETIDVHVLRTEFAGLKWYIKWYFVEPDSVFISVHN